MGFLRVGKDVSEPKVISRPYPEFTPEARHAGVVGAVNFFAVIRKTGDIEIEEITTPVGYGLDEAAAEKLLQWKFQPAMKESVPVDVMMRIEVGFSKR